MEICLSLPSTQQWVRSFPLAPVPSEMEKGQGEASDNINLWITEVFSTVRPRIKYSNGKWKFHASADSGIRKHNTSAGSVQTHIPRPSNWRMWQNDIFWRGVFSHLSEARRTNGWLGTTEIQSSLSVSDMEIIWHSSQIIGLKGLKGGLI